MTGGNIREGETAPYRRRGFGLAGGGPVGGHAIALIEGMMGAYGREGNAIAALNRVLPEIVKAMGAASGAVFIHREVGNVLECVVMHGAGSGDCINRTLPLARDTQAGGSDMAAPVSRCFREGTAVSGAGGMAAPIIFGAGGYGGGCFGVLWVAGSGGDKSLMLLAWLAASLALAMANLQLVEKTTRERLGRSDTDRTTRIRTALLPDLDVTGHIAGKILPARHIGGDFFDHLHLEGRLVFMQGNVAGRGIAPALTMARVVAVFRASAKRETEAEALAAALRAECPELAPQGGQGGGGFAAGIFHPASGEAEVFNCGHAAVLVAEESSGEGGQAAVKSMPVARHWRGNLASGAVYLATAGILLAHDRAGGDADTPPRRSMAGGMAGLMRAVAGHRGLDAAGRISDLMRHIPGGAHIAHADAAVLVVSGITRKRSLDRTAGAKAAGAKAQK